MSQYFPIVGSYPVQGGLLQQPRKLIQLASPCSDGSSVQQMEFSRQEYWRGLPFPSPRDLPDRGVEPGLLYCRWTVYPLSQSAKFTKKVV